MIAWRGLYAQATRGGNIFMDKRFIYVGDRVIAVNHIVSAERLQSGDVDVHLTNQPESTRIYAYDGSAQAFWAWLTSALHATELRYAPKRESVALS